MIDRRFATFADRWEQAVATCPDRLFLLWEGMEGRTAQWTYREFDRLVSEVAGGLVERGVGHGDRVHLVLTNSPAFVAVWLACVRIGAVMVPSDPRATESEIAVHVRKIRPVVGICASARAELYRAGARDIRSVVDLDPTDTDLTILRGRPYEGPIDALEPTDAAAILFTSGTTSEPKGVVITQANYAFTGDVMAAMASLRASDRQLVVLPLFHANAQYYSFASAISVGASVALVHTFSASRFLEQAARLQATHASLFAAPMRMILARGARPVEGLRLEHCWYAQNIAPAQYQELSDLLGCRPRQLYGMTETIPAVLTTRATQILDGALGVPSLGCRVAVLRPDSTEPVEPGEIGEIAVAGTRGLTLFAGYLDDPDTTAKSFDGEWFRTGDLAKIDQSGMFIFDGRQGDVLKVAGENISVVEVESVLALHPNVLEVAVVGEPDPMRDEVPVAYVVPRQPSIPFEQGELEDWCEQRLSKPKRPVRFELIEQLPRTSVGKIRKFMLGNS